MDHTEKILYGVVEWHPDPYYKYTEVIRFFKRSFDAECYCENFYPQKNYVVRTFYNSEINDAQKLTKLLYSEKI